MKNITSFIFLGLLLLTFSYSTVNATFVSESCTTGTYSAMYPASCDTCGYWTDTDRVYENVERDYWDYFNPDDNSYEYIFSNKIESGVPASRAELIDFGTYLNDESVTDLNFKSNWAPTNIADGTLVMFNVQDVTMNSVPATRDTPIGRFDFYIKAAPVQTNGSISLTTNWEYDRGTESGSNLTITDVSGGSGTKNINSSDIFYHRECYVLLPAWCGDGTVDSSEGESCDPADATESGWGTGGCSTSCQPVTTTSSSSSSSSSGGGTSSSSSSSSSGGGGSNYCGDGTIQRPNGSGVNEECEADSNGVMPNFCDSNCRYNTSFPSEGGLFFGSNENVIVGDGMNPYSTYSLPLPAVLNTGSYPLYVENLCVFPESTNNALIGGESCEYKNAILNPNQYTTMSSYPNFTGDTSRITDVNQGFEDNMLSISMKNGGVNYDTAYFASKMKVRVAKPTVATAGGGTSFVHSTDDLSDVNEVADSEFNLVPANIRNFVGAGISAGDISSYSKDVTDADTIADTQAKGNQYNNDLTEVTDKSGGSLGTTTNINDFSSYNGLDNVYILENWDFRVLASTFNGGVTGTRTYIIENGDLVIDGNIVFPNNIAFVVKGGNIEIDKDVTRIDGTYITITSGTAGGKFVGTGGKTFTNVLTVNGSLYGDMADLLSERTYVKSNNNGQLDVGTVVNFGSSIFKQPAPLVGKFIADYLDSIRIAK